MENTTLIEESSQKLKAILDGIGEGISIIDEDLKIVWVNPIIEEWAGLLHNIKGKNCYKIYQKRDAPCENCPTLKTFKTNRIEKARQHGYDNKGNIKYFEFTSTPMTDERGRIIAVVELAVDLTKKIELEHKLKISKERLQTIFDGIGDGISVIDGSFQILRVNQAILKLFNKWEFSDFLGKRCFTEYFKCEDICDNCPAQKTFETGQPCHTTKVFYGLDFISPSQKHKFWERKKDNKKRIVLDISTFPIQGEDGKVGQVIEYIKNISDIVKLEDQLLYQERLAGIGELAAGVAHEIRNPLGNITASAQFCLDKYRPSELPRKHLRIILKNAESANRIVGDLLDFAKPTEISFRSGHIGKVIDSTCNLVKARCTKQRVRITKRIGRWIPVVLIDEKRLEEAFLNFILNALDAMPDGGRFTITTYPDYQNKEIIITFSDTGRGISRQNINKVFNPFFTTKTNGTGLGLCLARQVINQHNGKVDIKSKVGRGTDVIVTLPISREPNEKEKIKESESSEDGNGTNS